MGKDTEAQKLFQPPTTDGEIPVYVQEAIDTYVEFTKYLNYRADVFRTSEQESNKMLKNYLEMIELLQDDSIDVTLLFNKYTTTTSN